MNAPQTEPNTFDNTYIERLASGDRAVEEHFSRYFGNLIDLRLKASFTQNAEDIRQETLLRVLRAVRKGDLRRPESLAAYVSGVCRFTLWEHSRSNRRYQPEGDAPEIPDPGRGPHEMTVASERASLVRRVFRRLAPRDRELLRMCFYEDADSTQMCARLRVTPGCLGVLLFRARKRFRMHAVKSCPELAVA
jgi:RNA polymerase sigma factor (sigma-70 family)